VLPNPPKEIITDFTKCMFAFIWNNIPDNIKRKQFHNLKENGGLSLPNIEVSSDAIKAG